uniref:At2g35280-like TPR domain-containing protein n=1 Tax=Lactuca sativa TaxID=4236 RepID=A0A9R1UMW6_LACSA|nr:hypothetical protein LSAT_V11C800451330 [Lactuca sativa]
MATSCSSERTQIRQQGTRITALPSNLIEKIVTAIGGNSPIDAFKCQLVCKLFRDSVTSEAINKIIDTNQLRFLPLSIRQYEVISRCRMLNNPHVLFNDGMAKYFMLGEEIAGKQLLQNAADQGQLYAIFVLGMMLMAEGIERKQKALIMLNNATVNSIRSWNLRHTCNKVQNHLVRRSKQINFHVLNRSCAKPPSVSSYGITFMNQYSWLFNSNKDLWHGCKKVTQVSAVARLLNIKLEYRIPKQSYDAICQLINDVLPEENNMVGSLYESKKLIQALDRYKRSKNLARSSRISFKKMHYFPLTPRLKRLYASQATAASMRWHSKNHGHDAGVMYHPSDSEAWKHIDKSHPSFAAGVHNVRLGLSTDGFAPHGSFRKQYSS